jgi:dihydrofolate reductase
MKTDQEIIIIAAMAENRVIGKNNALPWSIKADMLRFKGLTTGYPCIMGRKTYQSLPKRPLPHRENIVVSSSLRNTDAEIIIVRSLEEGIHYGKNHDKIYICGGASIYHEAVHFANKMELTLIHKTYEGDAYFPAINKTDWREIQRDDYDGFSFVTLVGGQGDG